jgi:hypothetical protein
MMVDGAISISMHLSKCSGVTPIGHILRGTKLDELPQLWNALKGNEPCWAKTRIAKPRRINKGACYAGCVSGQTQYNQACAGQSH